MYMDVPSLTKYFYSDLSTYMAVRNNDFDQPKSEHLYHRPQNPPLSDEIPQLLCAEDFQKVPVPVGHFMNVSQFCP